MTKKIELKVNFNCQKCKTVVLRAITKLTGVDQVSIDGEKGSVVVIGDVDPVCVAKQVRKTGMVAKIESVGPLKESKDPPKPPSSPKILLMNPLQPCGGCQLVPVAHSEAYGGGFCMIL